VTAYISQQCQLSRTPLSFDKPTVYVYVRPPKTGGTSLSRMLIDSRPDARSYGMPPSADLHSRAPLGERLRHTRNRVRFLVRQYRTLSSVRAWQYINIHARDGDLVIGHLRYDDPVLPRLNLKYFTLLRNPLDRLLSQYNYSRMGFKKRNFVQRAYIGGPIKAAGKYSFSGYLSYLDDYTNGDASVMAHFVFGSERRADPSRFLEQSYFHFGVLEQFERFTYELGGKLGVTLKICKKNVTPLREATSLSAKDRPRFERIFARDIELYEAMLAKL